MPYLRDHLAEGRPKGLFHNTPWICTLVLMSSTYVSVCSMELQEEVSDGLEEEENMVPTLSQG